MSKERIAQAEAILGMGSEDPFAVVDDRRWDYWHSDTAIHEEVRSLGGYAALAVYQEFCYWQTVDDPHPEPAEVAERLGMDLARFERIAHLLHRAGLAKMGPDPDRPGHTYYNLIDPLVRVASDDPGYQEALAESAARYGW
jgi:hypothetical protein